MSQSSEQTRSKTKVATDALETGKASAPYALARKSSPNIIEGRRSFLKYIDLGTVDASDGQFRAQLMSASQGLSRPTGWHYHVCDSQFLYMLSGWVDLAFGDGRTVRIEAGDAMFIPGGTPHNEIGTSDSFELLEISVPADMGTEVCNPPDGWSESD